MLSWRHEIPRLRASPRQYPALRRDGDATRPLASWRRALPALAALGLAACASGGASGGDPTLRIWPLADRGAEAIGSWRSELLSGAGADWARKALCRPDGGCTFFGSTRGSFGLGPGTAFIAVGEIPDLRPQWARTYGGGGTDELDGAVATPDGGFVMFGSSDSRYTAGAGGAAPAPRPLVIRAAAEGHMFEAERPIGALRRRPWWRLPAYGPGRRRLEWLTTGSAAVFQHATFCAGRGLTPRERKASRVGPVATERKFHRNATARAVQHGDRVTPLDLTTT